MKRPRGRNRKNHNSGSRSYDSNGPDVKIRGTATHLCDKYQALARDANASGDYIRAENYLQHAEHYFRIVKAAQANNPNAQQGDQSQHNQNRRGNNHQQRQSNGEAPAAAAEETTTAEAKAPEETPAPAEGKEEVKAEATEDVAEDKPKRRTRKTSSTTTKKRAPRKKKEDDVAEEATA